jgi:hypothetical protein
MLASVATTTLGLMGLSEQVVQQSDKRLVRQLTTLDNETGTANGFTATLWFS